MSAGGSAEPNLPQALQDALTAHEAGQARNRVEIGPGTVPYAGEADDFAGNPVDIVGSGTATTILDDTAGGASGAGTALAITEPTSTVSDLTIRLVSPPGNPATFALGGLLLQDGATAEGVDIDGTDSGTSSVGLDISGSSTFSDGAITMPEPGGASAVGFVENGADAAIESLPTSGPPGTATVSNTKLVGVMGIYVIAGNVIASRMTIFANGEGAIVNGGQLDLYDSLVETSSVSSLPASEPPSDPAIGLLASSAGSDATLLADHVTVVGDGTGYGLLAGAGTGQGSSTLSARNVVVSRYYTALYAEPSAAGTQLAVDYSAYSTDNVVKNQAFVLGTHNLILTDPGFANPARGNFTLAICSPLVDRGDPTPLAAGEPTVDLDGNPRDVSATPGGPPLPDIGALEYQPRNGKSGCAAVSIAHPNVRIVNRSAALRLGCPQYARERCAGTLTLSINRWIGVSVGERRAMRIVSIVIGRSRYGITQKRTGVLEVPITAAGLSLVMSAAHDTLRVTARATQAGRIDPESDSTAMLSLIG